VSKGYAFESGSEHYTLSVHFLMDY